MSSNRIEKMLNIYRNMIKEVEQLEVMFPGRHFTLDGHLIGSIGEAIAEHDYGVVLAKPGFKDFDGTIEEMPVQVKIVQQNSVSLRYDDFQPMSYPKLLVLYLNKSGKYYEVYNGPIGVPWDLAKGPNQRGYKHITIKTLMILNEAFCDSEKIPQRNPVPQMRMEYKNPVK